MRAVIQRVIHASVTIQNAAKGQIEKGLLVLLALEDADGGEDIEWLSGKIVPLRILTGDDGLMNRSVVGIGGDILIISQFTLYASTRKGNRPSCNRSARLDKAVPLYEALVQQLSADLGKPVPTVEFCSDKQVDLAAHGPVTVILA